MEENITESKTVEVATEAAVAVESSVVEAPKTLEEKFDALVKLLANHGIHLR